ncbi:MAG: hypothetical protein ACI3YM_08560 [Prevotella sp.]
MDIKEDEIREDEKKALQDEQLINAAGGRNGVEPRWWIFWNGKKPEEE